MEMLSTPAYYVLAKVAAEPGITFPELNGYFRADIERYFVTGWRELQKAGYVRWETNPDPAQPLRSISVITDSGREALAVALQARNRLRPGLLANVA
jgi:hypothetical protein